MMYLIQHVAIDSHRQRSQLSLGEQAWNGTQPQVRNIST
jgi:hypothetical protein